MSQGMELKGTSGPGWPGGSEHHVGAYSGQLPRPRAFSQSAVHSLERRERARDLEKVQRTDIVRGITFSSVLRVLYAIFSPFLSLIFLISPSFFSLFSNSYPVKYCIISQST